MGSSSTPKVRPTPLPVTESNADVAQATRDQLRQKQLRASLGSSFQTSLLAGAFGGSGGYGTKTTTG